MGPAIDESYIYNMVGSNIWNNNHKVRLKVGRGASPPASLITVTGTCLCTTTPLDHRNSYNY